MTTFRDLLAAAKDQIEEIDPASASARLAETRCVLVDVREPDEFQQGAIEGAVHIPRGHLESQIESRVPDRDIEVGVCCASGARSAFAAVTLGQLGYTNVWSLKGGFGRWKDEGRPWSVAPGLSPRQQLRYQRHTRLPEVGEEGQLRLLGSRVLLIGAGGLGSPAALYLAAAGVGTLGIVDMDVVDESNLQRQILHGTHNVGQRKVSSAVESLSSLNPDISVVPYDLRLDAGNVLEILDSWDVIIDGADNFATRYLLNDASVKLGTPVVHGSIFRFEGQVSVFDPRSGPTYRDYVPAAPPPELAPNCSEAGVLGVLPGIVGTLQAVEAIKLILNLGSSLRGRLLVFDALEMSFSEFKLEADPANKITWANRDKIEIGDLDPGCQDRTAKS